MRYVKTAAVPAWNPSFYSESVLYQPLKSLWGECSQWPTLDWLNRHYRQNMRSSPCWSWLRFIDQSDVLDERYESLVFLKQSVPTRLQDWHDFFNYLTWLQWPHSKWALIQRTMRHYMVRPWARGRNRNSIQNRLALFDEGGVVIWGDEEVLSWVREKKWRTLFVDNRESFHQRIQIRIFGHSLYEKLLCPYIGLTGNAVLIPLSLDDSKIDLRLAELLRSEDFLTTKKDLCPFPILGIPGAFQPNEDLSFYQNTEYFRS